MGISIIRSAMDIKVAGTLVLGQPADGKTTAVIRDILAKGLNPLVIVATNADTYKAEGLEWDVAPVSSWRQFVSLLSELLHQDHEEVRQKYDCVVVEGINYLASMALPETDTTQKDYLEMGRTVANKLLALRNGFGSLYVTLDVIRDDEGSLAYAINRDLYNRIISIFGNKWFAFTTKPTKDKPMTYMVQKNPTLAVRYVENGAVENA